MSEKLKKKKRYLMENFFPLLMSLEKQIKNYVWGFAEHKTFMDFNLINIKLTTQKFQFLSQRNLHSLKNGEIGVLFQHKEKVCHSQERFSFEMILIFIAVLWRKTQIKESLLFVLSFSDL